MKCSRDRTGCQRCKAEGAVCSYSRTGVLRRSRKQAARQAGEQAREHATTSFGADGLGGGLQQSSQLASDNADRTTQERLQGLVGGDLASLRQLASLLEEYAAAWQSPSAFGKLARDAIGEFHLFDMSQSRIWLDGEFFTVHLQTAGRQLKPDFCRWKGPLFFCWRLV